MTASYYNEFDKNAAAWLRELIAQGHLPPGDVDERSIEDVTPSDLVGYSQCHFFAGIGGWPLALRLAGWPEDRPVWTGSCPCQPFSAAGKGGGFADERHLWPHFHWLIRQCRPAKVFGEQVASRDGLEWFDLVHADLEGEGYAVGAADLCAAGFGAPHIRQRLYWVANAGRPRGGRWADAGRSDQGETGQRDEDSGHDQSRSGALRLADSNDCGQQSLAERELRDAEHHAQPCSRPGRLAHSSSTGLEGRDPGALGNECAASQRGGCARGVGHPERISSGWDSGAGSGAEGWPELRAVGDDAGSPGATGRVADTNGWDSRAKREQRSGEQRQQSQDGGRVVEYLGPGPTNGFWRDADWLGCRDGKWRPVEPGTFPLAHGLPARVGRLRGYGNAIVPQCAEAFIRACY